MTALAITPNYEKKRLKLAGTVAAGEHVAVTIVGGGAWIGTGKALRLRVICGARTVAKFPFWTEGNAEDWPEDVTSADAWASANDGADATCVLNLNTVPAAKLLRFGGMCLWVLDDAENHTLYGSGEYIVEPWPKERGEDEPYNLDEYPDIVAELGERIDAAEESISDAVDEANGIVAYVTAARNDAQTAAQTARVARNQAQTAQGKAEDAQTAAEAAQAAAEAALPLDATLATEGKAADAKAVGDAIALKADKSTTYTKSETYTKTETTNAISSAIATVVDSAPEAFDTLKEIADWIEDDQSGAAAMAAAIEGKVDKVSGKGLSANDYTDAEKSKLAGIAAGAQVNPTPIAPANATESGMFADAYWTKQDLAGKADKVANAVDGHLAGLDGNGNLTDSGCTPSEFATASSLAAVAFSGDYGDLANTPTIPEFVQVQSDWDEADTSDPSYIQNKPTALSDFTDDVGYVTDVSDKLDSAAASPAYSASQDYTYGDTVTFEGRRYMCISSVSISGGDEAVDPPDDVIHWTEWTIDGSLGDKADKVPSAASGDFAGLDSSGNLTDSGYAPTDFATAAQGGLADTAVQPIDLAAVATSGDYNDLSGKPTIPAAQVNADWNAASGVAQILNKPTLAAVATSGSYNDLSGKPTNVSAFTNDAGYLTAHQDITGKADKVANATSGNLAALDANGNLADSGNTVAGTFGCGELVVHGGGNISVDIVSASDVAYLAVMVLGDGTSTTHYINLPNADSDGVSSTFALLQDIASDFSSSATYAQNALCVYEGALYRCTTAVTSAGAWTGSTNWTAASVDDVLAALRTAVAGKQDALSAAQLANIAAVPNKADASALRYAMPAAVALTPSSDAATLVCADRAVTNATIATGFSTLNLTFPAAVSGYVRDFYLRITVAAGESAPAISVPQGITIENAGGAVPEIADGEASAAATTLVWFSETAPGVFTAKSETVKAVA